MLNLEVKPGTAAVMTTPCTTAQSQPGAAISDLKPVHPCHWVDARCTCSASPSPSSPRRPPVPPPLPHLLPRRPGRFELVAEHLAGREALGRNPLGTGQPNDLAVWEAEADLPAKVAHEVAVILGVSNWLQGARTFGTVSNELQNTLIMAAASGKHSV